MVTRTNFNRDAIILYIHAYYSHTRQTIYLREDGLVSHTARLETRII